MEPCRLLSLIQQLPWRIVRTKSAEATEGLTTAAKAVPVASTPFIMSTNMTIQELLSLSTAEAVCYMDTMATPREVQEEYHEMRCQIAEQVSLNEQAALQASLNEQAALEVMVRELEASLTTISDREEEAAQPSVPIAPTLPAVMAHVDRMAVPVLDPHHRDVVTRDVWSSSSLSLESSDISYDNIVPFATLPEPCYLPGIRIPSLLSPAISEWILTQRTEGDWYAYTATPFGGDLREEGATISPASLALPPSPDILPATAVSTPDPAPTSILLAAAAQGAASVAEFSFRDNSYTQQQAHLRFWLCDGQEHQYDHNQYEDEMGGHPLCHALLTLQGPLRHLLDDDTTLDHGRHTLAIVGKYPGLPRLRVLATVAANSDALPTHDHPIPDQVMIHAPTPTYAPTAASDSMPDLTQFPTSLDFSLPDRRLLHEKLSMDTKEPREINDKEDFQSTELHRPKRKAPDDKEIGEFQAGPRKRLRLTDPAIIRFLAGCRLGILEGMHRIENMLWHHYDVSEDNFPTTYVQHPLLFDTEAAKLHTLWNLLHHKCRYTLAALLFEVLTIHIKAGHALAHMLNAGYLEEQYPEELSRYWELLPTFPPDTFFESDSELNEHDFRIFDLNYEENGHESDRLSSSADSMDDHTGQSPSWAVDRITSGAGSSDSIDSVYVLAPEDF
ncbi:hypothetical protein C8R44DRAFT_871025 [Mycena epipterygia]|nr:hypothetical protein C8R44DRAFT_871025 [Mycena epipterygia]